MHEFAGSSSIIKGDIKLFALESARRAIVAASTGSRPWTTPQRDWLKRIANQTKANPLVDRAALNDPDLLFKREGGSFDGFDKLFNARVPRDPNNQLTCVLFKRTLRDQAQNKVKSKLTKKRTIR